MIYQDFPVNIHHDVKNTLALILAGGRGSRLKDLTKWRVKPAVPFGGKFRIIDFPLSNCINSGIRQIGVLTQYKSQSLIRHITRGWNVLHPALGEFIEILPAQQRVGEKWYSGTADAVYQNLDIIQRYNPEYVVILAGDHIYKMDYGPMISYHRMRGADLTIGCIEVSVEDATRFGVMQISEDYQVRGFQEKPEFPMSIPGRPGQALGSMGIYVFNTKSLAQYLTRDAHDEFSAHDFGRNIIPGLIETANVVAYPFKSVDGDTYWRDVGTVDSYWEANMDLVDVTPELNLYDRTWPIRTNSRQFPPAKFVFNNEKRRGMAVDSMVAHGAVVSGGYVERSLLSYNVRVESHAEIKESVILPNVEIGAGCKIRRAVIDKGTVIPPNTTIGEQRAEDEQYFYVSPGGVTLVTPEMAEKLQPASVQATAHVSSGMMTVTMGNDATPAFTSWLQ